MKVSKNRVGGGSGGPYLAGMVALWINFVSTVRLWRQRKRTRQLLAAFDDRMLKDIGLSPCDVRREATKPFWRQ